MIVITVKEDDAYLSNGQELTYLDNGMPYLIDKKLAFPPEHVNIYHNVASIPAEAEYAKWCYTPEEGFYPNPSYIDPNAPPEPTYEEQVQADYREQLAKEVAQNGYNA